MFQISPVPTWAKCLKVLDRSWIIKVPTPRTGNQHQHLTQSQQNKKKNISLPSDMKPGRITRYFLHLSHFQATEERRVCRVVERLVLDLVSQWMLFSNRVPLTAGSVRFLQAILVLSQYIHWLPGPSQSATSLHSELRAQSSQKNVRFARSALPNIRLADTLRKWGCNLEIIYWNSWKFLLRYSYQEHLEECRYILFLILFYSFIDHIYGCETKHVRVRIH